MSNLTRKILLTLKNYFNLPIEVPNENNLNEQELLYANYFHDSINGSNWLIEKSFCPTKGAANYSFLFLLYNALEYSNPNNILEFGLGQTSKITTQYINNKNQQGKLTIVESDLEWIEFFKKNLSITENITIEQTNTERTTDNSLKYQNNYISDLNQKYDFIIIDGPLGVNQSTPRSNILELIPQNINENFVIILDDYERKGEKNTANLIFQKLRENKINFTYSEQFGMKKQLLITSINFKHLHWM